MGGEGRRGEEVGGRGAGGGVCLHTPSRPPPAAAAAHLQRDAAGLVQVLAHAEHLLPHACGKGRGQGGGAAALFGSEREGAHRAQAVPHMAPACCSASDGGAGAWLAALAGSKLTLGAQREGAGQRQVRLAVDGNLWGGAGGRGGAGRGGAGCRAEAIGQQPAKSRRHSIASPPSPWPGCRSCCRRPHPAAAAARRERWWEEVGAGLASAGGQVGLPACPRRGAHLAVLLPECLGKQAVGAALQHKEGGRHVAACRQGSRRGMPSSSAA